ncbi:MAG TPA: CocE/NonD family hydrolase [Solirubrobacteraceae bacterium]|jgi:hypothetical protein|nr:CocE/NonD family hydrolase [Solirubrobacteraceae bacterium]
MTGLPREGAILLERGAAIAMRDGTVLRADIWRPSGTGRFPVLLQRFPYDKSGSLASVVLTGVEPARAVQRGFVVVVQDTRGRFSSEGVFSAFVNEARDGADTIAWIRSQPFSNGKVGMYGVSYGGATQLLAAAERPDGLAAIAPHLSGAETYEGWIYEGGAFRLGFALWWAANSFARAELARRRVHGHDVADLATALEELLRDPWGAFRRLPLNGLEVVNELVPSYREWVEHPSRDAYWRASSFPEQIGGSFCPALHIGGWNDIFLSGTLRNYAALGGRLIVGPWAHAVPFDVIGEADFGPDATQASLDMTALQLDWFDRHLTEPAEPDRDGQDRVRLFVMGANRWRDEPAWPLSRARDTALYLRSGGRLVPAPAPDDDVAETFVFDPRDPVPTAGGATFLPGLYTARHAGPQDQTAIEDRPDVLTYTSDVLPHATELTGYVTVVLHAASSASDTDWTAKLVDVSPSGRPLGLLDSIVRARYRDSTEREQLLDPERPYEFTIGLGAISIVIPGGHRLRLQISSSNFPKFDRNPNHGGDIPRATASDFVTARQTIFHDALHRSRLVLPVVR